MSSIPGKISLSEALEQARETRWLELDHGVLGRIPEIFRRCFGDKSALVIADANTFAAAGKTVWDTLRRAGVRASEPFVFTDPRSYAEYGQVIALARRLADAPGTVPIAVGSGTINDLTKLAASQTERQYLAVATAASMDGYTAFGASISRDGAKRTFPCRAPLAVVADLDVICAAPPEMNAAGYADLLAKITAGADWLVADALGVEPLHPQAWAIVQGGLRQAVSDPAGVRAAGPEAIRRLTEGLMLAGLAMQAAKSSRAASGSEHQFSHLWDMQHHTYQGKIPLHGFKVGLGTLAIAALYEYLLRQPIEAIDVEQCCAEWPDERDRERRIRSLFGASDLAEVALQETRAKAVDADAIRQQLTRLRQVWPDLGEQLRRQLLPVAELRRMLAAAGAPVEPEQIGLSREQLRESFRRVGFIRRRFTILDVAMRAGLLESGGASFLDH